MDGGVVVEMNTRLRAVLGARWCKPLVFLLCLWPLAYLLHGMFTDSLGANPIEVFTRASGEWALRLLLFTLLMTPLRKLTGVSRWLQLRRMLGLFAFFYVIVHFMSYLWLDQFFDWPEILADIVKRPFITAGMVAFLMLLPLALTSTNRMMRRLGRNWKRLHRLAWVAPAVGILHFFWLVKADLFEPILYTVIFLFLMLFRLPRRRATGRPAA